MKKKNKNSNKKTTVGLALIVAVFIIATGFFVYFENVEKNDTIEIVEEKVIDDRISPLENQGLILEVLRIRHRGLADKLAKFGTSWRDKPSFYFAADIDGKDFTTKDKTLFTTWDSMNQERKILRDAEEEQEKSEIILSIFEVMEKGIIFKKYNDVERDKLTVTYNYRTGRWSGDDSYKDEDGTGHFVGETFEIWFNIYQTDYDGDAIPYWTEVNILDTNPREDDSKLDPDEDGIPTSWEWKWGYNPYIWDDHVNLDPDIDGIENTEEYQMAKWLADPFHQDIYVEVDGMEKKGLFDVPHIFTKESQQLIIERFCRHGMCLYYDDGWPDGPVNGGGEILPHYSGGSQDAGMILEYYKHHFADERKGIFKYLLVGSDSPAFNHPAEFNRADAMHIYSTLKLYLGMNCYTERTRILYFATQAQHELGHSIGITPWSHEGCDNASYGGGKKAEQKFLDDWGNYPSVMNYYFINQKDAGLFFILYDYSDGSHGPGDQNDWEKIYLPTFQMEARVVEEYKFEFPPPDINEELEIGHNGWEYDPKLTDQFNKTIGSWSPVDPIPTDWFVLVNTKEDTQSAGRNIRIFAKPDVYPTIAGWTLSYEGYLDSDGNIQFYSQQDIIDEIMEQL